MVERMYPAATTEIAARRRQLAPENNEAFEGFSRAVLAEVALPEKPNQLIAVAVVHVTQCPYCISGHAKLARRKGASLETVSYTHLRAHETDSYLVCRLLLE